MNIKYNNFILNGDFELIDIKELGMDRDFIIDPKTSVININFEGSSISYMQLTNLHRLIFRVSAETNFITIHFLQDKDLHSSVANFEVNVEEYEILLLKEDYRVSLVLKTRI